MHGWKNNAPSITFRRLCSRHWYHLLIKFWNSEILKWILGMSISMATHSMHPKWISNVSVGNRNIKIWSTTSRWPSESRLNFQFNSVLPEYTTTHIHLSLIGCQIHFVFLILTWCCVAGNIVACSQQPQRQVMSLVATDRLNFLFPTILWTRRCDVLPSGWKWPVNLPPDGEIEREHFAHHLTEWGHQLAVHERTIN